ncbi:hypothetical protein Taro_003656 [Colocasia esculenta]|uniref:Uncharacterized protein n=1 Tax=Colocasia esculenta TaxID=4460 RepID=A0A843TJZ9_COLES|nr:hypothetical protein [Colocasia esculenta]
MAKGEEILLVSQGHRQPPPSTVLQILHEAAKLTGRSWKPLLSIFLILLLPYSFVFLGNYLTITPLVLDMAKKLFMMSSKDPRSPEFRELLAAAVEDLRGITGAEVASMLVSNLLSLLLVMATVYTVAMAGRGIQVSLKDLLSRMRTWKGPVATWLYIHLLGSGYTTAWFILIGVSAFLSHGSVAVLAVSAVIAILAFLLLVYLQVVWNEGLVVSVVEGDFYGLAALGRASELIQGRRILGFRVNLIFMLMGVIWGGAYSFVNNLLPPSENMRLASQLIFLYANMLLIMFMLAAYVVLYYECKKSHGEELVTGGGLVYTRVPTAAPATLGGALP